jgi:hypothetical protein
MFLVGSLIYIPTSYKFFFFFFFLVLGFELRDSCLLGSHSTPLATRVPLFPPILHPHQ